MRRLFWQIVGRELHNGRRADPLVRAGAWLGLLAGLGLAGWGGWALHSQVSGWVALEPAFLMWQLTATLGMLWIGLGAWAGMGVLRLGLASDEQQLLFTLPLRPAERWYALLVRVAREWVGLAPLALTLVAVGGGAVALGPAGLLLVLVAAIGMVVALFVGPLLAVAGAVLLLPVPLPPAATGGMASFGGRCYEALALGQRSRDRAPPARLFPGLVALDGLLEQRRTPAAALVWRGLHSQSRNWTFRLRLLMTPVLCAAGLWLHGQIARPGSSDEQLLAAFAVALALLTVADSAPSPVGGEGERLALLLVAPLTTDELLRGKLAALLLPVGAQALLVTAALGSVLQLGAGALVLAGFQVAVAVLGLAALWVGGSAFDSTIERPVEGAMQALLVEEAPVTPLRLALVGLGSVLAAAQIGLILVLDGVLALGALLALTSAVVGGSRVFGRYALRRIGR